LSEEDFFAAAFSRGATSEGQESKTSSTGGNQTGDGSDDDDPLNPETLYKVIYPGKRLVFDMPCQSSVTSGGIPFGDKSCMDNKLLLRIPVESKTGRISLEIKHKSILLIKKYDLQKLAIVEERENSLLSSSKTSSKNKSGVRIPASISTVKSLLAETGYISLINSSSAGILRRLSAYNLMEDSNIAFTSDGAYTLEPVVSNTGRPAISIRDIESGSRIKLSINGSGLKYEQIDLGIEEDIGKIYIQAINDDHVLVMDDRTDKATLFRLKYNSFFEITGIENKKRINWYCSKTICLLDPSGEKVSYFNTATNVLYTALISPGSDSAALLIASSLSGTSSSDVLYRDFPFSPRLLKEDGDFVFASDSSFSKLVSISANFSEGNISINPVSTFSVEKKDGNKSPEYLLTEITLGFSLSGKDTSLSKIFLTSQGELLSLAVQR